jgi:hypothetical protein
VTADTLVDRLIAHIPAKEGAIVADARTNKVLK